LIESRQARDKQKETAVLFKQKGFVCVCLPQGVVLATFSGHDHAPFPAYTVASGGHPMYFTHAALVEGPRSNSNAYSVVDVMEDCSIVVKGYKNASSVTHPGPPGCTIKM
jgi:hypothetical protein